MLEEIGLHVLKKEGKEQTTLDAISTRIKGLSYDHSMTHRIFTLTLNRVLVRAPKITRKVESYFCCYVVSILSTFAVELFNF